MNEGFVQRRGEHFFGVRCCGFNEVAKNIVVLDLERIDAREFRILRLHFGNYTASFVPKRTGFIKLVVKTGGNISAIAREHGRFSDQSVVEQSD